MDDILNELEKLSKIQRLIPPEPPILSNIVALDQFLTENLQQETIKRLENLLISLFHINDGNFSIQCSLSISERLVKTYRLSSKPQFFDLINLVLTKPCSSTIIAIGYVIKYYGQCIKSHLPKIVELLLRQGRNLDFAVVYSLRYIFKTKSQNIEKYGVQCYNYAVKAIGLPRQTTITACLKLIKVLIRVGVINSGHVADCIKILKEDQIPNIKNEMSSLIASSAYYPIAFIEVSTTEESEWTVGERKNLKKDIFQKPLEFIHQFPSLINLSTMHFLDLLSPSLIELDHETLFDFLRDNSVSNLQYFIPLLSEEAKSKYFEEVKKEEPSPSKLNLMILLCPEGKIHKVANAAIRLSFSSDKLIRRASLDFFAKFSVDQPLASDSYLKQCIEELMSSDESMSVNQIRGYSQVIRSILSNISGIRAVIDNNRDMFNDFIRHVIDNYQVPSPMLSALLSILSCLPEEFSERSDVCDLYNNCFEYIRSNTDNNLLKSMIIYKSSFPDPDEDIDLLSIVVKQYVKKVPMSVVLCLCNLTPLCVKKQPVATTILQLIIDKVIKLKISTDLIKKFLKVTLPTGFDLLKIPGELTPQQIRDQNILEKIIRVFPQLLLSVRENDHKTFFNKLTNLTKTAPIARLFILSICQSDDCLILPDSILNFLCLQVSSNNFSQVQISAESIGAYLSKKPNYTQDVIQYVEKLNVFGGCLVIGALVSYIHLDLSLFTRTVIYVNSKVKDPKLVAFALHAMSTLISTHSMEIEQIKTIDDQMNIIIHTLHNTSSLQPVVIHLITLCLEYILDIISIDLISDSTKIVANSLHSRKTLLLMIIDSIKYTPISYSKEAYFDCAKLVFTFAHNLTSFISIKFPEYRGASSAIMLSACDAYSYSSIFEILNMDLESLFDKIITLLQRTGDERAYSFMKTMSLHSENSDFWINNIRRIILSSSLYNIHTLVINPIPKVKECFLKVAEMMLIRIAKDDIIRTEYLDDIISSASKAAGSGLIQLQSLAYFILQKVIELFRYRKTDEGSNLLGLYDSQFILAVKDGFSLDLSVSGQFLYLYLSFNTEEIRPSYFNIINVYVNGLTECKQRSKSYFSLATQLCTVSRKHPKICENITEFLNLLTPIFSEIVFQSIELFSDLDNWRQMNAFRDTALEFYQELLPAFAWLQSFSNIIIPIEPLLSYIIILSFSTTEEWLLNASYEAIIVLFQNFGKKLSTELSTLTLILSCDKFQKMNSLIHSLSINLSPVEEHNNLRFLILSTILSKQIFDLESFAFLVYTDYQNRLEAYICLLSKLIIENLSSIPTDKAIALFYLIFKHYPKSVGKILTELIKLPTNFIELKTNVVEFGLILFEDEIPIHEICVFIIEIFRRGGLLIVFSVLKERPDVGVQILKDDVAKVLFIMTLNDAENSNIYLCFIELCSILLDESYIERFRLCVIRLLLRLIIQYSDDVVNGLIIGPKAIDVFLKFREKHEKEVDDIIDSLPSNNRVIVFTALKNLFNKADLRKKNSTLMTFSSNIRQRKDFEWESLSDNYSDE